LDLSRRRRYAWQAPAIRAFFRIGVTPTVDPQPNHPETRGVRLREVLGLPTLALMGLIALPASSLADDFTHANYDPGSDELVVTVTYSGTNPNHTFSMQWGPCQTAEGSDQHTVALEVLDSQWQDPARQEFSKTMRFALDGMPCRPATLTLRIAPRFITTIRIPAARGGSR
jgi:hypothetical protein